MKTRTYNELSRLKTLDERFEYLKMGGIIGVDTFGFDRYLNQTFYRSDAWKRLRNEIIIRDDGCELGLKGYEIQGGIIIHHMNPITQQDIIDRNEEILLNPNYLICCCSKRTHNAIHYGDRDLLPQEYVERRRGDTCPWIVY